MIVKGFFRELSVDLLLSIVAVICILTFVILANYHCWGKPYGFTMIKYVPLKDWLFLGGGIVCDVILAIRMKR